MIGVNGCMLENKDDFQFSENDIEKVEQAFKEYNNNTQKSFDAITTELSEKYGDSFEIQKVRNITGTEYIQAYVTSEKYPDVTFDAWVDRMTKEVTDDYLSMLIGFKIQQKLTRENYYFVSGDKIENSLDSRYWGLLPEPFIVGRAWRIWKSIDRSTDAVRWDRAFKKIK